MELDSRQLDVLGHARGALLVTGGFGTGKTTVLRERFLHLLAHGADPDRVVVVVGSRRAREEARRVLLARLPASVANLRVSTIHGLAYQVVSARYHDLRYERPPAILAAPEQFAKVQELLAGEDPERWPAYGTLLGLRGFADAVRQLVLRAQEALIGPDEIVRAAEARSLGGWRELAEFLRRYQEVLDAEGAVDFAGLVAQAAVAAELGEPPFDHVLVDDYQDATFGTERLLAALAPQSLVVAGNPDAHVYSFQGTTSVPLLRFRERFAADEVGLETEHRAAKVEVLARAAAHSSEEHAGVARELRRLHVEDGVPWRDLAIVVRRQGPHLGGLLRALDDAGVPRHAPESGLALTAEPATVPFTLAMRWIARPLERDGLAEPVLVSELGGLSPPAARSLLRTARASGRPPSEALDLADRLDPPERDELRMLTIALGRADAVAGSVIEAFRALWERLPYAARLVARAETSPMARRDLDAVVAFARAVERAGGSADPSVAAFVDQLEAGQGGPGVSGVGEADADAVQVLTAHGATGMEFDTVVVVGVTEGNFPSLTRPEPMFDLAVLEGDESRSDRMRLRLADERRLFASVLGRARRGVVLTASDPPAGVDGARSRFVDERAVEWAPMPASPPEPISVAEAAAQWRRTLADPSSGRADRLAALDGLVALGVDARRWWFQNDWTDTGRPLHERLRLSFSRLERLENCELQFVLGEELGLSRRGGYQAWVGKLVHELVEQCEKGEIDRSLDALVAALEERWQDAPFPSKAVSDAFKRVAVEWMLPNWFTSFGQLPAADDGTEMGFEFEFEGATITGKIDRIGPHDHGFRITDFKTGNPEKAPKAAESLQLGIYYLGVTLSPELERYRPVRAVDLSFLRGHWKTHEIVTHAWPVSPAGEEEYQARVRERLSGLVRRIRELDEAGTYRPDPTADCYFCDFKPLCPLYPEGQPLFAIEEGADS
ncbi:MAG TPA: ATP-dependent DNA helicase [Actinomycetota bacterium]